MLDKLYIVNYILYYSLQAKRYSSILVLQFAHSALFFWSKNKKKNKMKYSGLYILRPIGNFSVNILLERGQPNGSNWPNWDNQFQNHHNNKNDRQKLNIRCETFTEVFFHCPQILFIEMCYLLCQCFVCIFMQNLFTFANYCSWSNDIHTSIWAKPSQAKRSQVEPYQFFSMTIYILYMCI